MKKIWLPALLLAGWMWLMNADIPVGENFLPAPGRFFSPFSGVYQNTKVNTRDLHLTGTTQARVKILFDERDIPHIYAESLADALYAQGFLHAYNRLFAMDVSSRAAAGRLSELIGPRTIEYDRLQRQRGFEKAAIDKAEGWEQHPANKILIDAYVKGVNAYISSLNYRDWPIEYKLLSHEPVTWTARHTALMATNMAVMLCLGESDIDYTHARNKLSAEDLAFLYPDENEKESPIIPKGTSWNFNATTLPVTTISETLPVIPSEKNTDNKKAIKGSNNWAVAPSKSASGKAILANDPHLSLTLPNIWYEIEIHTPEMHVHGVSLPGLPFILIGFNDHIAWGSTNSGQDVLDWYQIHWQDSTRRRYLLDGNFKQVDIRAEEIKVRGGKTIVDSVRYTSWGPVITTGDHADMAMKWIGHIKAKENDLDYLKRINAARNLEDYRKAVEAFQYPAQNKVFASVDGDIAISVAGVMPLRNPGEGSFILNGSKSQYDWKGFIPFAQAPYFINPSSGYVSSANQMPAASDYPYPFLGQRYFEDFRGRVINDELEKMNGVTVDDMQMLQQNNYNLQAAELLPVLLSSLQSSKCGVNENDKLVRLLSNWNYQQHKDSIAPVLYEIWNDHFQDMFFDELDSMKIMHPEEWRITEMTIDTAHRFFDLISTPGVKETREDIVCASFEAAVKEYNTLDHERRKNWGAFKASEIPHLARLAPFGIKFISTSGNKHIVNAMGKSNGPSWRMVVEMTNPPKAFVNYPGGQSGNPASPHYQDFVESFFEGKYYQVTLQPDPVSWNPVHTIEIKPQ